MPSVTAYRAAWTPACSAPWPTRPRVAQAASALCSTLQSEYAQAETLVGAIERTLDANLTNKHDTETEQQASFTMQQV